MPSLIELNRTYRAQSNAIERSIGFDCSFFFVRVRLCSITELNRTHVRFSSSGYFGIVVDRESLSLFRKAIVREY